MHFHGELLTKGAAKVDVDAGAPLLAGGVQASARRDFRVAGAAIVAAARFKNLRLVVNNLRLLSMGLTGRGSIALVGKHLYCHYITWYST